MELDLFLEIMRIIYSCQWEVIKICVSLLYHLDLPNLTSIVAEGKNFNYQFSILESIEMCSLLVVIDIPNLKNVSHPESLKGTKKTIMNSILIRSCFMTRCLICSNWSNPGWIKFICGRWFKNRMIVSEQFCLFYYLFWLFAILPVHFASISYTRGIVDLRWIYLSLTLFYSSLVSDNSNHLIPSLLIRNSVSQ